MNTDNAFIRYLRDNGTNFVGAVRETRELIEEFDQDKVINETTRQHKIQWKFNSPSAPHFGGVFEAIFEAFESLK